MSDTQALMQALINGDPITGQLLKAMATGDPQAIFDVLDVNGYTVTDEDLVKAMSTTEPGPTFDIHTVAGLYAFSKPQDMVQKTMVIDPTTDRIMIDANDGSGPFWVGNTTDPVTGYVLFEYDNCHYTLTFPYQYKPNGLPGLIQVRGTRVSTLPNSKEEDVVGQQVLLSPSVPWYDDPTWLKASLLLGVLGVSLGFLIPSIKRALEYAKTKLEARREQIRQAQEAQRDAIRRIDDLARAQAEARAQDAIQAHDFENVDPGPDDLRAHVHDAVPGEVRARNLDPLQDIGEVQMGEIAQGAVDQSRGLVAEDFMADVGSDAFRAVGDLPNIVGTEVVQQSVRSGVGEVVRKMPPFSQPINPFMLDSSKEAVFRLQAEASRDRSQGLMADASETERLLEENERDLTSAQREKAELEKAKPPSMSQEDYNKQLAEQSKRVEQLDREGEQQKKKKAEQETQIQQQEERARKMEEQEKLAREQAKTNEKTVEGIK